MRVSQITVLSGRWHHLVDIFVIAQSLIPRRSRELTSARVQSDSDLLLQSLDCFENLPGLLLLGIIPMHSVEGTDRTVAGREYK